MIYPNILFGSFLRPLYSLFPATNPDRLLMALVSDDDMYYVGYDASLLQRYLSQHTGQPVEVEVLYTFDCGASVYAFYVPSVIRLVYRHTKDPQRQN